MKKLISWNVNGIRSVLNKGFLDMVKQENPDVLCVQEIKAHPNDVDNILKEYPFHIWNPAEKKGYSGTVVFSKLKPLSVKLGKELMRDNEGRVIIIEFDSFYLVNVYTPNAQRGLTRLKDRIEWDKRFLQTLQQLERHKPLIFCGDLNVAHTEIDIARPKANGMNAGFTKEEREGFDHYMQHGFIDTFRHFYPQETGKYTWWSYMHNAREKNIGWRIDYICVSRQLAPKLSTARILTEIRGSDHCPISLVVDNS